MTTPITIEEAETLLNLKGSDIYTLLNRAHKVRLENRPPTVNLCGIVNAKSGMCTEDCKFCAQSAHNDVKVECYKLLDSTTIAVKAKESSLNKASRFGIVTSGHRVDEGSELLEISSAIKKIRDDNEIMPCASLGNISKETLLKLKESGLTRYHCNLETAQSFYPQICTTRPWSESVETVKTAKEIGLAVCSGGLFGLGESAKQRVELLEAIRELDVDSVPLNFFYPVEGTKIDIEKPLSPLECLKIVAVARLMLPEKEIRVCGGREFNFGDLQSWILISGADGMMVGGYLTTRGRAVEDDLKMIKDAGFEVSIGH
ncbi:MAG: biotin synthase BioB [Deltaproteobacteria bacterium]|nr:biotin synthase BioB [Deltaproteobacteria bacterium]